MDISIILGTYNRAASLRATLETFANMACPPDLSWELLVVDNNSSDATPTLVRNFATNCNFNLRYLFEPRQGRSAALNAGIAEARGEIVAFTDDDVLLHRDWLANVNRAFQHSDCAAVAGRVMPLWKGPKPGWLEMKGQFAVVHFDYGDELKEIKDPPLGANSAFRRDVFRRHGCFRLDLGVTGAKHAVTCDDTEFGLRLIRAGEKILYCPSAIVYHPVEEQRTTKKYFLDWYYYNGVSLTRTYGLPRVGHFYFGVPRWLFREALANLATWMATVESNPRFQNKLNFYRSVGKIAESYRLSRRHAAEQDLCHNSVPPNWFI